MPRRGFFIAGSAQAAIVPDLRRYDSRTASRLFKRNRLLDSSTAN